MIKFGGIKKNIELVILKVTGLSKNQLFLIEEINNKYENEIRDIFRELYMWKQIEYIIEKADFYGLDFFVDNRVLLPRDETEIMVSNVISEIEKSENRLTLIDVWTWSSCIPVSIFKNISSRKKKFIENVFAVDVSSEALEVAEINIQKHKLENGIKLVSSDLLTKFLEWTLSIWNNKLVVTANLPYIKQDDFKNMDKSVYIHEPSVALYWWTETWFELYEKLIEQLLILKNITKEIILFIEIWFDQYEISKDFLENKQLKFEYFYDNNKIRRILKIKI